MNIYVMVDMQNDFISGVFGTKEAQEILPKVINFVKNKKIFYTMDEHNTIVSEGIELQKFGKHCMEGTVGRLMPQELQVLLDEDYCYRKDTFMPYEQYDGKELWDDILYEEDRNDCKFKNNNVYVFGLCTDICVLNTALYLRNNLQYDNIIILKDLCAGTTPEKHEMALKVMESNLIEVK